MKQLNHQLNLVETYLPHAKVSNTAISSANIAWHIEHLLLVIDRVSISLSQSNPENYKWRFSLPRILVMMRKKIPRGRGKAPKAVRPESEIYENELQRHLATTRKNMEHLSRLPAGKYFSHPLFGDLKLKQAIIFLQIHTQHHIAIIQDIVGSR